MKTEKIAYMLPSFKSPKFKNPNKGDLGFVFEGQYTPMWMIQQFNGTSWEDVTSNGQGWDSGLNFGVRQRAKSQNMLGLVNALLWFQDRAATLANPLTFDRTG